MTHLISWDHDSIARSIDMRLRVHRLLLRIALRDATTFRLEFDYDRLRLLIGDAASSMLVPTFTSSNRHPPAYDRFEGSLGEAQAALLIDLLAPEQPSSAESPFNYIRSLRLLDRSARTVLRIGDHGSVHFVGPGFDLTALIEGLSGLGLPADIVCRTDVDMGMLEP